MDDLTVADLMTEDPITVGPKDDIARLYDLMGHEAIRHLPVVDDNELVGILSERDLIRAVAKLDDEPVTQQRAALRFENAEALMSKSVETVGPEDSLVEAADRMFYHKLGCLPVVEGGRVIGIITEADFVKFVANNGEVA